MGCPDCHSCKASPGQRKGRKSSKTSVNSAHCEFNKKDQSAGIKEAEQSYRQCWEMFGGRVDVSTEVELIDLPEGDDVDPVNVTAADLRGNTGLNVQIQPWTLKENAKRE